MSEYNPWCQNGIFALYQYFKMRFFTATLLFIFFISRGFAQSPIDGALKKFNSESVPYIGAEEVYKGKNMVLLDAREIKEYRTSHLQHAIWTGFETFEPISVLSKIEDKNTAIVVYCSIGVRSEDIGEKVMALGYTNVKNLYGGIFEWKNKGYPVFDAKGETNKVHVYSKQWEKYLTKGEKIY